MRLADENFEFARDGERVTVRYSATLIEDQRYHSPDCTDRVTSHTWESSGKACGTATEISTAPEYLREEWKRDRLAPVAQDAAGEPTVMRARSVIEVRSLID